MQGWVELMRSERERNPDQVYTIVKKKKDYISFKQGIGRNWFGFKKIFVAASLKMDWK